VNAVTAPTQALPTVATAPVKLGLSKAPQTPAEVRARKVDVAADLQANKEALAQRLSQSLDKSQLDYSFDKASSTLSVKVVSKPSGEFIRQIDFKGFQAMAFSSHGYKGRVVDHAA
jgi:uncharacterized FlaG/YvyC family protein